MNDAFNTGMEALKTKQYDNAVQAFTKAGELDLKQHVIWGNLAEVYSEISKTKTGPEKDAALAKAYENYQKAIECSTRALIITTTMLWHCRRKQDP